MKIKSQWQCPKCGLVLTDEEVVRQRAKAQCPNCPPIDVATIEEPSDKFVPVSAEVVDDHKI